MEPWYFPDIWLYSIYHYDFKIYKSLLISLKKLKQSRRIFHNFLLLPLSHTHIFTSMLFLLASYYGWSIHAFVWVQLLPLSTRSHSLFLTERHHNSNSILAFWVITFSPFTRSLSISIQTCWNLSLIKKYLLILSSPQANASVLSYIARLLKRSIYMGCLPLFFLYLLLNPYQ